MRVASHVVLPEETCGKWGGGKHIWQNVDISFKYTCMHIYIYIYILFIHSFMVSESDAFRQGDEVRIVTWKEYEFEVVACCRPLAPLLQC